MSDIYQMTKFKTIFLALAVAMLTAVFAHAADSGTQYSDTGVPVFNWDATYSDAGDGYYVHRITIVQLQEGSLTVHHIWCNNESESTGTVTLSGLNAQGTYELTDKVFGQDWHWSYDYVPPSH